MFFGLLSTFCEAKFYRTVVETINERVGRYLFFMLLTSAGMWSASTALLPSSFAMYTTTLAFGFALQPPSQYNPQRTFFATLLFAIGAIVGWPFSLALAIPFVLEELFIFGADRVSSATRASWMASRWKRLTAAGILASLVFVSRILLRFHQYINCHTRSQSLESTVLHMVAKLLFPGTSFVTISLEALNAAQTCTVPPRGTFTSSI